MKILDEILTPYQKRWVEDQSRFKIGLWSRQTGKSFATACEAVFDCSTSQSSGDTQRLHWLFNEIESANPVLSMAVTRRAGAVAGFAWRGHAVNNRAPSFGRRLSRHKEYLRPFRDARNKNNMDKLAEKQ